MTYDVFISYRRDGGEALSQLLATKLTQDNYKVFYDIESMRSGKFNEQIYQHIDESKIVIAVLPPNALDRCVAPDDWVRLELARAIKNKTPIVPIMMRNFVWPKNLPEDLKELPFYQGCVADFNFFDSWYGQLKGYINENINSDENIDNAKEADFSYDLYDQLSIRFKEMSDSKNAQNDATGWIRSILSNSPEINNSHDNQDESTHSSKSTEQASPNEAYKRVHIKPQSSIQLKIPECMRNRDGTKVINDHRIFPPPPEIVNDTFTILDSATNYTMVFAAQHHFLPAARILATYMITVSPCKEEFLSSGDIRRSFRFPFYRENEQDRLNERHEFALLTIKESENCAILNGAEAICKKGEVILNVGRNPGKITYSSFSKVSDLGLGDMVSENLENPFSEPKEFFSDFSPEKLSNIIIDPVRKELIKPTIVRIDGKLKIRNLLIPHYSYIALQMDHEDITDSYDYHYAGVCYLHGDEGVPKNIFEAANAFHDGIEALNASEEDKSLCFYELGCMLCLLEPVQNKSLGLNYLFSAVRYGIPEACYQWAKIILASSTESTETFLAADIIGELLRCGYKICGDDKLTCYVEEAEKILDAHQERFIDPVTELNYAYIKWLQNHRDVSVSHINNLLQSKEVSPEIVSEAKLVLSCLESGKDWPDYSPDYQEQYNTFLITSIEEKYGPYSNELLAELKKQESVFSTNKQHEKSIALLKKIAFISEKIYGSSSIEIIDSLTKLADAFELQENYIASVPIRKQIYEINRLLKGNECDDTLQALKDYSYAYYQTNQFEQCIPLDLQALSDTEKIYGIESNRYATMLNNLAMAYRKLGQYSKALPLMEKAYLLRQKLFGDEDPKTIRLQTKVRQIKEECGN